MAIFVTFFPYQVEIQLGSLTERDRELEEEQEGERGGVWQNHLALSNFLAFPCG